MNAPMKVYVHLAHGYDARDWRRRFDEGSLIGVNEPSPYGYHHAESPDCRLRFSRDAAEGRIGRLVRGGLRLVLGFDLVHAWRNRAALHDADVVWTHTESQHLGIAAMLKLMPCARRPKLLAQSVWLMDRWDALDPLRKALYRWLMSEASILTFHSPLNHAKAQQRFPNRSCELVCFGINADAKLAPCDAAAHAGVRILAVGNDRHRDWPLLLEAFGGRPGYQVRIATGSLSSTDVARYGNVTIVRLAHNGELMPLYRWADAVVLPLRPNLHASGSTVLQEAALAGRPAICSRAGGLDSYFTDDEVSFVPTGDPDALRRAVDAAAADRPAALRRAQAAQARMALDGLSSRAFARAHVALSHRMLRDGRSPTPRSASCDAAGRAPLSRERAIALTE